MALTFHPKPGTILMCDFSGGFIEPEMVKKRPVLVISPKRKHCTGLCTVIAISTVEPRPEENWHYKLPSASMPSSFRDKDSWLKGDMISRVAFSRLNLVNLGKDRNTGKRIYFQNTLGKEQMKAVYGCVLHSLNLSDLPQYL